MNSCDVIIWCKLLYIVNLITILPSWTYLGLRISSRTRLSSCASMLPMNNCSTISINTYLHGKRWVGLEAGLDVYIIL